MGDSNFTFLMRFSKFYILPKFFVSENRDDEDKSATLQKKHFNSLSQCIGDRWKRFARQFNIPDQKVVDITNEYNREYDRCYKVFLVLEADHGMVKWKMVETALKEIKLNEIISEYTNLK